MTLPVTTYSTAPRILIVRVGAMGDVLHGMPAVAALRAALPGAEIGWAVEPRWSPLLCAPNAGAAQARLPLVDVVHAVEAKAWSKKPFSWSTLRSIRALRHTLRQAQYDIAVDLQGTLRSAVIARMSGARHIVGSASPRERPARWFYRQRVPTTAAHVVDQAAEIVSAAMAIPMHAQAAPLPVDSAAEAWAEAAVSTHRGATVVLAPTAGWGAKEWPAERFGQLARALHERGFNVLVNASPHGADRSADQVIAASGNTAQRAACTLPQLIALVRRACLVVAGDTGPLHLAAALGVPVVALFGPTDPSRNGPYGTRSAVLRHTRSRTDHHRTAHTEAGLAAMSTDEVLAAVLQMVDASPLAPEPSRAY